MRLIQKAWCDSRWKTARWFLGYPHPITIQKLQVRLHSNLDGSSLAHAIQVPMGPLRNLEVLHLFRWFTHTHTLKSTVFPQHSLQTHASLPPKSVVSLHKRNACLISFKYLVSLEVQETLSSSILKQRSMLKRFSFQHTVFFSEGCRIAYNKHPSQRVEFFQWSAVLFWRKHLFFNQMQFCWKQIFFSNKHV